ncbi:UNVERIFIED_ORG: hypothetical protein ABIB19_003244 [Arthrobacter sp. UYEF10]
MLEPHGFFDQNPTLNLPTNATTPASGGTGCCSGHES